MKKIDGVNAVVFTLACVTLLGTSGLFAQRFEITPFAGYRFGGGFKDVSSSAGDILAGQLDVKSAVNLGVVASVALGSSLKLELSFDRQDTELSEGGTYLFDTKVNYYHAGLMFHGHTKVEPFFAVTTGATHFQPSGDREREYRGSLGLIVGGRTFFSRSVGVRFQSRFVGTYMGSNDQSFCSPSQCYAQLSDTYFRQIDFSAGLILRF